MQMHGRQSSDRRRHARPILVDAAEMLFAEHGIGAVSLREINRAAGAKNAVAVQYHFGDRAGILRAIAAKHFPAVDARRHAMLDEYEAKGEADIRTLGRRARAAAGVEARGSRRWPRLPPDLRRADQHPAGARHVGRASPTARTRCSAGACSSSRSSPTTRPRLHRRFAAIRFSATEIGRRARTGPHRDDRLFVSDLIDLVTGMLSAPPSDETTRLMKERDTAHAKKR